MSLFQLEEEGFGGQCVRDPDSTLDPFAVPSTCPAGEFYNRTKGYRLVAGDTCQVVFTTAVLFFFFLILNSSLFYGVQAASMSALFFFSCLT